jgi:lysophospholipase
MNTQNLTIKAVDNYLLQGQSFCPNNYSKQVIIVLGNKEIPNKYYDFIQDLYNQNLKVICFNLRGQGFNEHLLSNKEKCHINNFNDYVTDIDLIIKEQEDIPTYIIAISLGSLITLNYLKNCNYSKNIKGIIFLSPCLGINSIFPDFLIKSYCYFKNIINTLLRNKEPCFLYSTNYEPRIFGINANTSDLKKHNKYFKLYDIHPEARLGGVTPTWLLNIFKGIENINSNQWDIPINNIVILSKKDNIISFPKAIKFFKKHNSKNIDIITFDNSLHDILIENQNIYQKAIQKIIAFIEA